MPRLFAAISGHGFGHMAQVAPILQELKQRFPKLEITLQCTAPTKILDERLGFSYQLIDQPSDVGLLMDDALTVKVDESVAAYRHFHANWDDHLNSQIAFFQAADPDIVLCDVPYMPLVAAKKLDIPTVALCSLNWVDILKSYAHESTDLNSILETMTEAYQSANVFLQPEPSMPMEWLINRKPIGPVATQHQRDREALFTQLRLPEHAKIILIALGGIDTALDLASLPVISDHFWLVTGDRHLNRQDCINTNELKMPFGDILSSVDAVITKPGYGTFVEAANASIPLLYFQRSDWPEEAVLTAWLKEHATAMELTEGNGFKGIEVFLKQLLNQHKHRTIELSGVKQAADIIQQLTSNSVIAQ